MGWIALWFVAALANASETNYPLTPPAERSVTELRKELRVAMKAEAIFRSRKATADHVTAGSKEHVDSIARLLALHCEMVRHSTFAEGFALRESRSLLQSRLVRIARSITANASKQQQPESLPGSKVIPAIFEMIPVLAQQLGPGGGNRGPVGGNRGPAGAGGGVGGAGPGGGFQQTGQLPDYGPELVDLIQRVISPDSWDIVGGPSTIVYYAPLRAIVVRGTLETHENLIQLLFDLRAAGGP